MSCSRALKATELSLSLSAGSSLFKGTLSEALLELPVVWPRAGGLEGGCRPHEPSPPCPCLPLPSGNIRIGACLQTS
eukprot:4417730-Alexandrium_andersonii.AAC.1